MNEIVYKCLKTVTSYVAHAALLAEFSEEPVGYIPRVTSIPSPYAWGPVEVLYTWHSPKGDKLVFVHETGHRRYQVFEVLPSVTKVYATDEEATKVFVASSTKTKQ